MGDMADALFDDEINYWPQKQAEHEAYLTELAKRERNLNMAKKLYRGPWTRGDVKELRRLFKSNPTAWVAHMLGRPFDAVKKKASRMGLKKGSRYLKSIGRTA